MAVLRRNSVEMGGVNVMNMLGFQVLKRGMLKASTYLLCSRSNISLMYLMRGRSCDKRLGTPRNIPSTYSFLLLLLLRLILMHGIVASKAYLCIDALHNRYKRSELAVVV